VEINHIPKPADDVNEVVSKLLTSPLGPAAGKVTVFAAYPDEQGRQFKGLLSFRGSASGIRTIALLRDQSAVVRLDDAKLHAYGFVIVALLPSAVYNADLVQNTVAAE
jgi:hypothetical protein